MLERGGASLPTLNVSALGSLTNVLVSPGHILYLSVKEGQPVRMNWVTHRSGLESGKFFRTTACLSLLFLAVCLFLFPYALPLNESRRIVLFILLHSISFILVYLNCPAAPSPPIFVVLPRFDPVF
jgi:hypothetical protein